MEFTPEGMDRLCKFFELLLETDLRIKSEAKARQELVFVLYLILVLRKKQQQSYVKMGVSIKT